MRTTTVVWDLSAKGLPDEEAQDKIIAHQTRMFNVLAQMEITDPSSNLISETLSEDGNQRTVIRTWSDLASAQQWISSTIDAGSTSAIVNPE